MNYYNEFDPKAAAWLRELIKAGAILDGFVDERSITHVDYRELAQYTQCHFFAGIGGWARALQIAGWPDDKPVWTGSCPCQPFSAAGKQMGRHDPRHLWPAFRRLINRARPSVVFGEQVASADGREWLAGVCSDLETMGYAAAGADLCAAGAGKEGEGWIVRGCGDPQRERIVVGAPHIRQRLYWVAYANGERLTQRTQRDRRTKRPEQQTSRRDDAVRCGLACGLADTDGGESGDRGIQCCGQHGQQPEDGGVGGVEHSTSDGRQQRRAESSRGCTSGGCRTGGVGDTDKSRSQGRDQRRHSADERLAGAPTRLGAPASRFWSSFDILPCTDGKARRIEPGSFPLAHGVSGRVGLLRGYGNAIVPQLAAEFIEACEEVIQQKAPGVSAGGS